MTRPVTGQHPLGLSELGCWVLGGPDSYYSMGGGSLPTSHWPFSEGRFAYARNMFGLSVIDTLGGSNEC